MTDTVQEGKLRTRRSLLTAAAGGAAALAVGAIKPGSVAAAASNMQTETNNLTAGPTGLTSSALDQNVFFAQSTGEGIGVVGQSGTGPGVWGVSTETSDPLTNNQNAGVVGVAANDSSDIADNIALSGVYGYADADTSGDGVGSGVWGDSPDIGVAGTGATGVFANGGWGVRALTGNGIGVYSSSDDIDGLALLADGRAAFSRSGRTTISAGSAKKAITLSGVTASSLVLAVLAQNRSGRYVRAVVPDAGKFTIYLNQSVGSDTKVTWIVFTNPSNLSG